MGFGKMNQPENDPVQIQTRRLKSIARRTRFTVALLTAGTVLFVYGSNQMLIPGEDYLDWALIVVAFGLMAAGIWIEHGTLKLMLKVVRAGGDLGL